MLLFLTDDLVFPFRVRGLAKPLGVELIVARPRDVQEIQAGGISLAFIDLEASGPAIKGVIDDVRQRWPQARIVAFGPHIDAPLLESARAAGCEVVLPRSQFVQRLAELVAFAIADG